LPMDSVERFATFAIAGVRARNRSDRAVRHA